MVEAELKARKEERNDTELGAGTELDMLTRYSQHRRYSANDVWRAYTDAQLSESGTATSATGMTVLQDYKDFVYGDALADDHEETEIRRKTFHAAVDAERDDMLDFVTDRRAKALPVAIETFNKIQGRKLPSWNADIKLNLYKNPDSPTKQMIMDGRDPTAEARHAQEVQEALHRHLSGELDGDAKARIAAEEKIFSEPPASDMELFEAERLLAGYLVKDPSKINQTITRYGYLLEDSSSPLLSNFTGLLDYRDGSDMPSMEELEKKGNVNS